MDRDPQAITDDIATVALALAALDPEHFWPLTESGTSGADSGYGSKAITLSGTPTRQVSLGYGLVGTRFDGSNDFGSIAATPRASSTTFSILAWLKPSLGGDTNQSVLSASGGSGPGFYFNTDARKPYFIHTGGFDLAADLPALAYRTLALIAIRVTAGVAEFGLNGVFYEGGGGSDPNIPTFTPDRVGGNSGSTGRLCGDVGNVVYMPGVLITDQQFAELWAQRHPCHTASLAVVNQALSKLGQSRALTDLSTDATPAGVEARLQYPTAVESVLRAFAWPFANRYEVLELVEGTAAVAVNSDWQYSYRAPDRMVRAIRIVRPGLKRLYDPAPPPFAIGQDAHGWLLFTDYEDAELEYTTRTVCPALHGDVFFREALSWYLAYLMAPTVAKDEQKAQACLSMFGATLSRAVAGAANEQEPQDTNQNDPDWITNR